MTSHPFRIAALASLLLVGAHASSHAAAVYDNLAASQDGSDPVFSFGPLADSFSTGASGGSLQGVTLLLQNLSTAYTGSLQVGLYADNATSPGSLIASIGSIPFSSVAGSLGTYTVTPTGNVALAAGTRYWVEVSSSSPNALQWSWTTHLASTGVTGEYTYSQELGVNANSAAYGPYQMSVQVAAVPEPASLALLAAGLAVLCTRRQRKGRGASANV